MKAATVVNSNTDKFSKPSTPGLFHLPENNDASAMVNGCVSATTTNATSNNGTTIPMDIFGTMSAFPCATDPLAPIDSSTTCWNMSEGLDMSSLLDPSLWAFDTTADQSSSSYDPLFDLTKNQQQHPLSQTQQHQSQQPHHYQHQPWIENQFHQLPPTPSSSLSSSRFQSPPLTVTQPNVGTSHPFLPPTPPVDVPSNFYNNDGLQASTPLSLQKNQHSHSHISHMQHQDTQSSMMMMTLPFDPHSSSSSSSSSTSSVTTSQSGSPTASFDYNNLRHAQLHDKLYLRRRSDQQPYRKNNSSNALPVRRRASSVASVVSLTAHEPIAHMINGVEHITFLYSHDRLIKEYTVRTDVNNLDIEDVPMDFRLQNAIYPRANVNKEEYDGNRWNYETSCNQLGWKLCWLNRDQLFGKRGLIQRAVDSYRNRHTELRSRRVTRQEKLANGTLRKRRAKKLNTSGYV